jgi:quercetin dioxygenase-like cupin family protein
MNKPSVSTWSETPSERVFPGIVRQITQGERQTLVRYVYEPGAVFPVHNHPEEQVTVVISGHIEFDVDGQLTTLGPGQVAVIPANVPHGAMVVGSEIVETFNALSPRRTASPFAGSDGGPGSERR